jgi:hypothetical protein
MTRRFFLTLVGAAPLMVAESWEQDSFPNWTQDFVDKLLTDSPWAKPVTVAFEFQPAPKQLQSDFFQIGLPGGPGWPTRIPGTGWPGGGRTRGPRTPAPGQGGENPSVRTEVYLTIRWSSALPIRQALALERWGRDGLQNPKAVEFLNHQEPDYVVEIFGLPAIMVPRGTRRLEEQLAKTATLFLKGHRPMQAASAEVPEYGEHLLATLRFPRFEAITADDGIMEFQASAGPMKIEKKFKLKPMVYRGRLEL